MPQVWNVIKENQVSVRAGQSLLGVALVGLVAACAPPPLATDVSRVRDLSATKKLSPLEEGEVDLVTTEEVRGILAKPIDVEAAVRVALLNNRELRARLRELGVVRGQITQAGTLPNPLVELELLPERNTTLEARVEYDAELDTFRGEILGLNGGADFYGKNPSELQAEFKKSLQVFLEVCREKGIEPLQQQGAA